MLRTRSAHSAICTAVALALYSTAAHADLEGVSSFSIPPQSLSAALIQFSSQADVQVVGSTATLANLDTNGVSGQLTGREALRQLLGSHALRFEEVTNRSVKILPLASREAQISRVSGDRSLLLAQAEGSRASSEGDSLEEIVVTGKIFNYDIVESAYKLPIAVKDIPQSVKVITPDMMQFARVERVEDLYKVDAGAYPSHLIDGYSRAYYRGFLGDSDNAYKLDGMRAFGVLDLSMATLERLEIVKGSTSTMYGRAIIGGTVNMVSKKPTKEFGFDSYLEGGTYDHWQGGLDVRGALTGDEKLSGRLVADYLDEESHIDYFYKKTFVVAPSLSYELSPDTKLTFSGNYQNDDFLPLGNFGVQVDGDFADPANYSIPDVPRSRLANQPDGYNESKLKYGRLLLESRLTDTWQLRASGQYAKLDTRTNSAQGVVTYEDLTTDMETFGGDNTNRIQSLEAQVFGDVELFGRRHTLFLGADYYESKGKGLNGYASLPAYLTGFSLYAPDYSLIPGAFRDFNDYSMDNPALATVSDYVELNQMATGSKESGVTAQLIAHPTDRWTLLVGGRYSDYKGGRGFSAPTDPAPAVDWNQQHAFTWQVGTTFAITPEINAYASFGESFVPRFQYAYDEANPDPGRPVGPERGEAYEAGIKSARADGKFSWSAALFDIARTNITQQDLEHVDRYYVLLLGKQRSRGIELDAQGELLPGWSVYASAAYTDNEFVEGEFEGYPAFFAPRRGFTGYTSYVIQSGQAKGLGFGGGFVYKDMPVIKSFFGSVQGKALDLFDDVFEVDARVFYDHGPWSYSLSATNLTGQKYYSTSYPSPFYAINVNPGRQFIGRVGYTFR